jgi:tetratricopeptide (TPR) repeat protein
MGLPMVWFLLVFSAFAGRFDAEFREGLIALNESNYALARSKLETASQLEPRNAEVWVALAETYRKLNQQELERTAARNAEQYCASASAFRALSLYYSEAADFVKAAALLQRALSQNPYQENLYFEVAQLQFQRQEFSAALETLDAGRKYFDKSPQLELAAGVAYYGLRRFPEAMDAFLRTIQLDAAIQQPYVFLGRMLDQAEDRLPRITSVFAGFAKRAPDNYLSNYLYGKALLLSGDLANAESFLRKSTAQNPSAWEPHFELAVVLRREQKFEAAAEEMRAAIRLNPNDPVPHYHLAQLYDRLGMTAAARAERETHASLTASTHRAAGIQ